MKHPQVSILHRLFTIGAAAAIVLTGCATLLLAACQQSGSAPKLQSHLAAAQTSAASTAQHIHSTKGHLETADYKGSRTQKLLNEGVEQ